MGPRPTVKPSLARRVLWIVRDVLFLAADSLVLACVWCTRRPQQGHKPKVAIVAAHGIGDLVLLLPVLEALVRHYPRSRFMITLVCSSAASDFARLLILADEVISIDRVKLRRNLPYRLAIVGQMRRTGFSIAVQPNFNRDLLVEDSLIRATGAPTRIGSEGTGMFMPPLARLLGDFWYSRLIPASRDVLHELERNAEFMRNLDFRDPAVPPASLLRRSPSSESAPYVLFVVGSSSPLKTWPLGHFEWLASAIAERVHVPIVFCAGAHDGIRTPNSKPTELGPPDAGPPNESHAVCRIRLPCQSEFMALISGAGLVVSNDSAATHIAAALRIPSVCIVGGGIVGRYHPYPSDQIFNTTAPVSVGLSSPMPCFDCGWRCCFTLAPGQPAPCIEAIEPARVLAAALKLLLPSGTP